MSKRAVESGYKKLRMIFLVRLTAARETALWFSASADLWTPKQSPLTGVYHRVLSVRDHLKVWWWEESRHALAGCLEKRFVVTFCR